MNNRTLTDMYNKNEHTAVHGFEVINNDNSEVLLVEDTNAITKLHTAVREALESSFSIDGGEPSECEEVDVSDDAYYASDLCSEVREFFRRAMVCENGRRLEFKLSKKDSALFDLQGDCGSHICTIQHFIK